MSCDLSIQTMRVNDFELCFSEGGWVKYSGQGAEKIDYPKEDCLVFDTENIVAVGQAPVMVVALSKSNWYSWISPKLFNDSLANDDDLKFDDLIDFGDENQILIGHNVAFDRSKVADAYRMHSKKVFLDTMSFHVATNGCSSQQLGTKLAQNSDLQKLGKISAKNRYLLDFK